MEYLKIGCVSKPVGLKGQLKIFSTTDFSFERYKINNTVFYKEDNEYKPLIVKTFRKDGIFDVVSFENYEDINLIAFLLKKDIYAIKDELILPKDLYYFCDLINCDVFDNGKMVGKVIEIQDFPAHKNIKCKTNENKIFVVPFVKEFIKNVDTKNKRIDVVLIDGIL